MIVEINTNASLDEINEALALVDAEAVMYEAPGPHIDPTWEKLPPTDSQRQLVLLTLVQKGNATRDELSNILSIPDSAVDGRILELRHGGWVVETDEKRLTEAGKPAKVLTPAEKCGIKLRLAPTVWFPNGGRIEAACQ
jgi:hypothetical protein